ncbi:hypothetical protein GPA22_04880 [Aromatoleum toluvorans]|uniref:GtrA/DPMS transmembrane domain-containing protein n=1 Tax=Aromatoleum toluvorans TaxID=92002 RepID=A0ABX1PUM6_9RHOO|nr:hypothetical protein [Aromatoleum toluvorans]
MKRCATVWRFGAVGVGNTAVGLASIYGARASGLGEVAANAAGYAIGLMFSFALNRHWTFAGRGPLLRHAVKFLLVVLSAWLLNIVTLLGAIEVGLAAAWAQAVAVLPYVLVSYCGCRWWVFADRPSQAEETT